MLEHLLKNDFRDVGSKVSHHCTNLHEIAQTESGNVSSRARKVRRGKTRYHTATEELIIHLENNSK